MQQGLKPDCKVQQPGRHLKTGPPSKGLVHNSHDLQDDLSGLHKQWSDKIAQASKEYDQGLTSISRQHAQIEEALLEKIKVLQDAYSGFLREQHERRNKPSSRWLPKDDTKVISEFTQLKKEMKIWSRNMVRNHDPFPSKEKSQEKLVLTPYVLML